jgi:hypothetical protein
MWNPFKRKKNEPVAVPETGNGLSDFKWTVRPTQEWPRPGEILPIGPYTCPQPVRHYSGVFRSSPKYAASVKEDDSNTFLNAVIAAEVTSELFSNNVYSGTPDNSSVPDSGFSGFDGGNTGGSGAGGDCQ